MTQITLPPNTRTVGSPDPPGDMNKVSTALSAMQATSWVFPTGDTTGAQDSANLAAVLAVSQVAFLGPATPAAPFYWNAPAAPDSTQIIAGCGSATAVKAGSGWSGSYLMQLAHPASTYQTTIRDLYLIPGTLIGSVLSGPGGIQIDNTGRSGGSTTIIGDSLHHVENVTVFNSGGDGFHFDHHIAEMRVINCKNYRSAGYGFFLGNSGGSGSGVTDSHFTDCTSGFAETHGFYIAGAHNMLTGCKSFASGNNFYNGQVDSVSCGFEVTNTLGAGNYNTLTGCHAQQNGLHGVDLQSVDSCGVVGGKYDSNGAATAGVNGAGINIVAATNCAIVGNTGGQTLIPGNQTYGILHTSGVSTGTWIGMNPLTGSIVSFQFTAGSGYNLVDTQVTDFSQVTGQFRVGLLEQFPRGIAAVATGNTITPQPIFGTYPVSLAANATGVILAAGSFGGQQLVIVNTSATHSLTFAASGTSNVADGVSDVIAALQAATYTWDANTSLWYRM